VSAIPIRGFRIARAVAYLVSRGGECPLDGLGIAGRVLDGPLVLERVDEPKSSLPGFAFCRLAVINNAVRDGSVFLKKSSRALARLS
jgi:hypothetical protein